MAYLSAKLSSATEKSSKIREAYKRKPKDSLLVQLQLCYPCRAVTILKLWQWLSPAFPFSPVVDSSRMLCNELHKLPPDATTPRRFKFPIPGTKNDISGDGPVNVCSALLMHSEPIQISGQILCRNVACARFFHSNFSPDILFSTQHHLHALPKTADLFLKPVVEIFRICSTRKIRGFLEVS